jgi:hypothetical protein
MNFPFTEEIKENCYIRSFNKDVNIEELVWHRDREDRLIECIGETNWKFQRDNELPICFDKPIFIKAEIYHRLIKGNGDLILKIIKILDKNN